MEDHVRRAESVMMSREDPVEAALVRGPGHRQREVERLRAVHLAGVQRADVDAEPHTPPR